MGCLVLFVGACSDGVLGGGLTNVDYGFCLKVYIEMMSGSSSLSRHDFWVV